MPDSKIVDTRKFTNKNNRTAPKINGASEMKHLCLKETRNYERFSQH